MKQMSSLQSRVLVSVIGLPLLIYIVLFSPEFVLMAALMILSGIGAHELMQCVGVQKNSYLWNEAVYGAVFAVMWAYRDPLFYTLWLVLIIMLMFANAVYKAGAIKFVQVLAGVFAVVCIPYSFCAFLRINAAGWSRVFLLLPFVLSFMCDTCAYFAGRAFGKHKLAPKVSPKKTVEGSVGGMLGNVVGGLVFAFAVGGGHPAPAFLLAMVVLSLLCGIVSQLGDLSFSLIKREYGIKDYGHLFLEHGGVLDRFDSVLFVAPIVELVLRFVK